MEIEEMKSIWQDLSRDIDKQKRLTDEIIKKMAGKKSSSRLERIIIAESVGLIVTIISVGYLFLNFHKLDNWPALVGGIGITFVLFVSMALGIKIIVAAKNIDLIRDPYKEVLKAYTRLRKVLHQNKWVSSRLVLIIPPLLIPALYTVITGKNIANNTDELIKALIGSLIFIPIVWYLILRFYKGNMSKINEALKDIEDLENS